MPEGVNIEVAERLNEKGVEAGKHRSLEVFEIVEALLLAFVSIATAWSGYQAATWDGRNALYYGLSSKERTTANKLSTLGGQQRLYDITTFNSWLQAKSAGNAKVAALFERRFTPEYRVAFDAWLTTNPFHNPYAPAGPIFMPQYHNAQLRQSAALEGQAAATFDRGTTARETADTYVRDTLFLASTLFLIALSQRFQIRNVRRSLIGAAVIFLVVALFALTTLPIA